MATEPPVKKPYVLQVGLGVDLTGQDSTKAAVRAVEDAIARNRLLFREHHDADYGNLSVSITLAVPEPASVNVEAVRAVIEITGAVDVAVEEGGLRSAEDLLGGPLVAAVATVIVGSG